MQRNLVSTNNLGISNVVFKIVAVNLDTGPCPHPAASPRSLPARVIPRPNPQLTPAEPALLVPTPAQTINFLQQDYRLPPRGLPA
ncbi:hypothetical protein TIFTF001_029602 [Ficus carica]|uniref:Uncharacterized protein n=1 Tax=Ficus carica TaxID=3494 RepID=A0AA88DSA1_FICCA|nr:hypothetical protein TIFTF001_029602 [Ficus carica]